MASLSLDILHGASSPIINREIIIDHDLSVRSQVRLHQFNQAYDETVYLPLSIAYLQAACNADQYVSERYHFGKMIYTRANVADIMATYDNVEIYGFSLYVWNERISMTLAETIKKNNPKSIIVFGGPSVPSDSEQFLNKHPFIDYLVHGEGEMSFVELLTAIGKRTNLLDVPGISFKNNGEYFNTGERTRSKDLDCLPSPFLTGVFDEILNDPYKFQGIWETNRGCPFQCSFCFWGSNLKAKIAQFSMDRLQAELDWISKNKIEYIYAADANFGILARDVDICEMIVQSKITSGYPQSFFINYSKNTDERVFKIAKRFYDYDLCKGTTLSLQSLDDDVLDYIKRRNIKMSAFKSLQKKYREAGVPSYTELILPLPGETLKTFVDGVEETIQSGGHDQLYVHLCRLLPNTEMSSEDNRTRFGLKTRWIPIQNHVNVGQETVGEKEFEEIVIETNTLPTKDWKMAFRMSWMVIVNICLKAYYFPSLYLYHSLGVQYTEFFAFVLSYVQQHVDKMPLLKQEHDRFDEYLISMLEKDGATNSDNVPNLLPIRWPMEEITFIVYSANKAQFIDEMKHVLIAFLRSKNIAVEPEFIDELSSYQRRRMVSDNISETECIYHWDFGRFAEAAIILKEPDVIAKKTYKSVISEEYHYDNYHDFLKHHVWYGRRRKKFYYPEVCQY